MLPLGGPGALLPLLSRAAGLAPAAPAAVQRCAATLLPGGGWRQAPQQQQQQQQQQQLRWAHSDRTAYAPDSIPLHTGRPRLLVLGTGWAAARLCRDIDPKLYDLTVLSPRNHMVFTPLLASTTSGTVETRSVALHITSIQPALHQPQNQYLTAEATAVFPDRKLVEARSADGLRFYLAYDKLAICTGSQGSTFGIPGVEEHAHFLRDVRHAEEIRSKLIENIALASVPGRPLDDYSRLLHVVIVGGGPTGVEVAGELSNLINRDLRHIYPARAKAMRVTVVEAKELLGTFDGSLREYAARKLVAQGVELRKGVVKVVERGSLTLTDGTVLPFGLCIWSTGVGPTPFTLSLPFEKTKVGRIAVDPFLRVLAPPLQEAASGRVRGEGEAVPVHGQVTPLTREHRRDASDHFDPSKAASMAAPSPPAPGGAAAAAAPLPDVYALGDCCANQETPLPPLAQVAEQQGRYLARVLNDQARDLHPHEGSGGARAPAPQPFVYRHLGSMATVGGLSAVLQLGGGGGGGAAAATAAPPGPESFKVGGRRVSLAGFLSWVAWRSAYLTRLGTVRARMQVAFDWTITLLFGRDLSRW